MALTEQRKKELDALIARELEKRRKATSGGGLSSMSAQGSGNSPSSGSWLQSAYRGLESVGGALGKAGQTMLSPVTRTTATAIAAGRGAMNLATGKIGEEAKAQEREKSLPPEWRPVRTAKETVGVGLQLGAMLAAPGAAQGLMSSGASPLLSSTLTGGMAGLAGGAGAGLESSSGKGALETAGNVLWGAAKGGTVGLAGGFLAGKLAPTPSATQKKIDEYVAKSVQSRKAGEIAKSKSALTTLTEDELGKIRTYDQLTQVADENVSALRGAQDDLLSETEGSYRISDFDRIFGEGETKVAANPLKTVFGHLKTLYEGIGDAKSLSKVSALEAKAAQEGLTIAELNQLARDYGTELSQKAFSKSGEALTSISAKAEESARLGMKDAVSSKMPKESAQMFRDYDEAMSKWLTVRRLSQKAEEGVRGLTNRIVERTTPQKIGRALGILTDKVTFGTVKSYVQAAILPSNVGLKQMNWIDVQKALNANLRTVKYLSGQPVNRALEWIVTAGASALGRKASGQGK